MKDELGYKRLTPDNWREPDPTSGLFARVSPIAGPMPMIGDDWARAFLAVGLREHVPAAIRDLFGVARGAMLYGWFFYPLFTLAEEQLYRVAEAAVSSACGQLRLRHRGGFASAVEVLEQHKAILDPERWKALRTLRNASSHPARQAVMPPGQVLATLRMTAHEINGLFARVARMRPNAGHDIEPSEAPGVESRGAS